jgi:hypothetical protein
LTVGDGTDHMATPGGRFGDRSAVAIVGDSLGDVP